MSDAVSVAKDIGLFLLALYGAVLSTFNLRQGLKKERRLIEVRLSTITPTYGPQLGPPLVRIEAVNVGHRPVTVITLTLELPDGSRLYSTAANSVPGITDTPLPAILSDGATAHLYIAYREIGQALIQSGRTSGCSIIPVCEDSAGGIYKGLGWDVDPHEFIRM